MHWILDSLAEAARPRTWFDALPVIVPAILLIVGRC